MQSSPVPFIAIAALALCAIVATKALVEVDDFRSDSGNAACGTAMRTADGKRCCAAVADGGGDSLSGTASLPAYQAEPLPPKRSSPPPPLREYACESA